MKIEKIADHNFVVKNDEGVVVYKARSRKACASHIANIAAYESISRDEIIPITNHRICPSRQTVCIPKTDATLPEKKEGKVTYKQMFINMLKDGPKKMSEIRQAPWNYRKAVFYDAFNGLVAKGWAKMEDGRMMLINMEAK